MVRIWQAGRSRGNFEFLAVILYVSVLFLAAYVRMEHGIFRALAQSLNVTLGFGAVVIGFVSIFRRPAAFWTFASIVVLVFFLLNLAAYRIAFGSLSADVQLAVLSESATFLFIVFVVWIVVEILKAVRR